ANWGTECNVLLKRRGADNSTAIETYLSDGGYEALKKAKQMAPAAVVAEVKESGLRGLGGAGFPTGTKWGFLPKDSDKPVYLICNADEGEPGTFKDRQIMQYDPHLMIEGMAIACHAIGAKLAFVYIRGEFKWIADILERAIEQAREKGILSELDIIVHLGAGAYICGEETALIESLEGKRGNPRLKPPFPAVEGLYGCPTIVNNVETLASLPFIIAKGAAEFKKFGSDNNHGFKIFGVSGHVNKPGTYEFPMGTALSKILAAAGGVKGTMKAVIVGGLSVPILTAAEAAELNMDFDGCRKKGTLFGSGGIMVINDTTSIPKMALRTIDFYTHESCGQCTPCREGTWVVKELLTRLIKGYGTKADIDRIIQICDTVIGTTLCPVGEAYGMPIGAMVKKFRSEFEALLIN
ncbi:MAG: NADH-quinone oxidoreductase subunit NuoF, partial [Sedimentisphaerales bacterium]|nr:NADH-quinone oxidoreductase subunit NuoF [Sedimentisphaerales bacterium]